MTLDAIPAIYSELFTCGCKTTCASARCTCNKNQLACSLASGCMQMCNNLNNISNPEDEETDEEDSD